MTESAAALVDRIRTELAPREGGNRLVALVASGSAPVDVVAMLAAEELTIVDSDRRAFLLLASRSRTDPAIGFWTDLAQGESLALDLLPGVLAACGWDDARVAAHEPRPGCRTYPAFVAWLALNGDPVEVLLALLANFAAWGESCARISAGLREHYGFTDAGCAFFDFFATPVPTLEEKALAAVQAALDAGASLDGARRHGRLLQHYELEFWNSLGTV